MSCLTGLLLQSYGGSDINLQLNVRMQKFIELDIEPVDSLAILICVAGYPIIGPGENTDAPGDLF